MADGRQRLTDEIRLGRIVIQYSNSHSTPQIESDSSSSTPRSCRCRIDCGAAPIPALEPPVAAAQRMRHGCPGNISQKRGTDEPAISA
jgi:hypothetical protein